MRDLRFAEMQGLASRYTPGTVVGGRYELVREIGHGGFGHVWLAKSRLLCNEVALKLLVRGNDDEDDEENGARLLREARAAAAVDHPAVLRVFDFGETRFGDPFLVMELLNGENLEDLLAREGRLQPHRAVRMILPVMHGLAAAHAKGFIHRDIKLANVVLSRGDAGRVQPKIIDFGLARAQSGSVRITREGFLAGTPAYMSPEQARSEALDARSDVWSASVALYELLTGKLPFQASTAAEAVRAIIEKTPEPISADFGIDPELCRIVMRGLEKKPDDRWQSIRAMGCELARWLEANGVHEDVSGASIRVTWLETPAPDQKSTAPIRSPVRRHVGIAIAAIAAIAVLVVAVRAHHDKPTESVPVEKPIAAQPMTIVDNQPKPPTAVTTSPAPIEPAPVTPRKVPARDLELGF